MLLNETCYYLENQVFGGVNTRDMSLIETCFCSRLYGPVKHLKMTVRTSVLWKITIHMAKKWPEIVLQRSFIKGHSFPISLYSAYFLRTWSCHNASLCIEWFIKKPNCFSRFGNFLSLLGCRINIKTKGNSGNHEVSVCYCLGK